MELNIKTFLYIFLHLCPLILVCFFTISSIFNNDLKGMVYLFGLLFSIAVILFGGNLLDWFNIDWLPLNPNPDPICKVLSFGNGDGELSIGQMIIGFSFFYLLTTMLIGEDNLASSNWPTITFFSLLMLAEILINTNITELKERIINWWYYKEIGFFGNLDNPSPYCYHWITSLITYTLAGSLGAAYAAIIQSWNNPDLQYFGKYKNNEKCGKIENDSKKTFACRVFKNGSKSTDPTQIVTAP